MGNKKRIKQWIQILNDRTFISKDDLRILLSYAAEGGEATCLNLANKYSEDPNFYSKSSLLNKISTKYPELGLPLEPLGKDSEGTKYRLNKDLYEALKEIDSSSISLYSAKVIEFVLNEKNQDHDFDKLIRSIKSNEVLLIDKTIAEQRKINRFVPGDFAIIFVKSRINAFCQITGLPFEENKNYIGLPISILKEFTDEIHTNQAIGLMARGTILRNSGRFRKDLRIIEREFGYSLYDLWKYKVSFGAIHFITQDEIIESEEAELTVNRKVEEMLASDDNTMAESYVPVPEPKKQVKPSDKNGKTGFYPRDPQKRINALERAGFQCECNPEHRSFISKKTNKPYMETHHLVPLEFWNSFDHSLDVEANIVCLCSNCHNEIHYGKNAGRLIETLFKKRKTELSQAMIITSLNQLLDMYGGKYTNK